MKITVSIQGRGQTATVVIDEPDRELSHEQITEVTAKVLAQLMVTIKHSSPRPDEVVKSRFN